MIKLYPLKNEYRKIDHVVKIAVVGESGTGKTNLLYRFTGSGEFSEGHNSTIGVDFVMQLVQTNDGVTKVQFWDTGGKDKFRSIVSSYIHIVDAVIIVFDVNDPLSSKYCDLWLQFVNSAKKEENTPVFFIGNKTDLLSSTIDPKTVLPGKLYYPVSAKTGDGVDEAFKSVISKITPSQMDQHLLVCYGPRIAEQPKPAKGEFRMKFDFGNIFSFFQTKKDPEQKNNYLEDDPKIVVKDDSISAEPVDRFKVIRKKYTSEKEFSSMFNQDVTKGGISIYENLSQFITSPDLLSNVQELKDRYGKCLIPLNQLSHPYESAPPFCTVDIPLEIFLDNLVDTNYASMHYLQQLDLRHNIPQLLQDAGIPLFLPHILSNGFIPESECHEPTFFIGIKTSLHYDRSGMNSDSSQSDPGKFNLFHQLSGKRRFILFPPHLAEYLDPMNETTFPHISKSMTFIHSIPRDVREEQQIEYLSHSTFPKLAKVWSQRYEIVLQPGETLLISPKWWHCTELLETGSALNWWFSTLW